MGSKFEEGLKTVTGINLIKGPLDTLTGKSAEDAARAATDAASIAAGSQREALDYLKEREAIPQQFREGALTQLGGLFGLEGGEGSQQMLIDQAMNSPLYNQLMGNQQFGEDAILRNASATGGLRSGNVQANLADYNTRLANDALLNSYNQQLSGIQGLANLPSNANQIAGSIAGIGQTQAQGMTAGANAIQQGNQALTNNLFGLGGMFLASDIRLKQNIKHVGKRNGHNWYEWDWNDKGAALGLLGHSEGVLAHEVYESLPEAVSEHDGYIMVDYSQILEGEAHAA